MNWKLWLFSALLVATSTATKAETFSCQIGEGVEFAYYGEKPSFSKFGQNDAASMVVDKIDRNASRARLFNNGKEYPVILMRTESGETFVANLGFGTMALSIYDLRNGAENNEAVLSSHFMLTRVPSAALRRGFCKRLE